MFRMQTTPANIHTQPTAAELLFDTGRVAKILLRQGTSTKDSCVYLRCDLAYLVLACDFCSGNQGMIVRALVEDWSLARIVQAVRKQQGVASNAPLSDAA